MKKIGLVLGLFALLLVACGDDDATNRIVQLEEQKTVLENRVAGLETRLADAEKKLVVQETEIEVLHERLRDVSGVVDRVTVRLDRLER